VRYTAAVSIRLSFVLSELVKLGNQGKIQPAPQDCRLSGCQALPTLYVSPKSRCHFIAVHLRFILSGMYEFHYIVLSLASPILGDVRNKYKQPTASTSPQYYQHEDLLSSECEPCRPIKYYTLFSK
jgi:hypothetical protein